MSPLKNKTSLQWVDIRLDILRKNLKILCRFLKRPSSAILAIVKAEAYGHGMLPVSRALWKEGVRFFGVANFQEALVLRQALPKARILLLGCLHPDQVAAAIALGFTPTISCLEDAKEFQRRIRGSKKFLIHVKLDTGMGRLGLPIEQTENFFKQLKNLSGLEVEGLYTHFSSADKENQEPTLKQLKIFNEMIGKIKDWGFRPRIIHVANSAGTLRFRQAHFDMFRPGLILYGLQGGPKSPLLPGMKPVLSWKTRISFLKKFETGQTVSYGQTHQVQKNTLIATLPVGYSHGYRIAWSNRSFVLVRGYRCPVVGRVTMDQTLVDVGSVPGVQRWDEVTLIGKQGRQVISTEELAEKAQTIPYEVVCGIHSRVPRVFSNHKENL